MKNALQSWHQDLEEESTREKLQSMGHFFLNGSYIFFFVCNILVSLSSLLSCTDTEWEKSGFVDAVTQYCEAIPPELFDSLKDYLELWVAGRWQNKEKEKRR